MGLARLGGLVAEAVHEGLHVLALGLLLCPLRLGDGHALGPCPLESVVGAGVEGELSFLEMKDRVDGGVEEAPVVADQKHRPLVASEVLLEPKGALEVEIVRRFVEQQELGVCEQHRRQRNPHAPSSGKVRAWPLLCLGIEAKACKNFCGPCRCAMRADIREPRLDLRDPHGVGGAGGLCHEARAFDVSFEHCVDQRSWPAGYLLGHAANAPVPGNGDIATVAFDLVADQSKQGCLARSIATDQSHLVASRNVRARPFEQGAPFNPVGQFVDPQHQGRSLKRNRVQGKAGPHGPRQKGARRRLAAPALGLYVNPQSEHKSGNFWPWLPNARFRSSSPTPPAAT